MLDFILICKLFCKKRADSNHILTICTDLYDDAIFNTSKSAHNRIRDTLLSDFVFVLV